MRKRIAVTIFIVMLVALGPVTWSQQTPPKKTAAAKPAPKSAGASAQELNTEEYIELLRSDVRQQKAEIMGSMMQLSASDAAKFWPIYSEYDAALQKLNGTRVANIQQYAAEYNTLTDDQADALIQKAAEFQQQRNQLLVQYYKQMKDALGAVTAARFIQIEHQLLLIIDLQIDSALPLAGQSS
jgi:hypothetical protein